jgi:hypothetical protein
MVAGPALCFYTIEQGNGFAASAARIRGLHSFVLFCFVFSTALGPLGLPLLPSVVSGLFAQLAFQAVLLWWMSNRLLKKPAT